MKLKLHMFAVPLFPAHKNLAAGCSRRRRVLSAVGTVGSNRLFRQLLNVASVAFRDDLRLPESGRLAVLPVFDNIGSC
jgi:hypothetical protein